MRVKSVPFCVTLRVVSLKQLIAAKNHKQGMSLKGHLVVFERPVEVIERISVDTALVSASDAVRMLSQSMYIKTKFCCVPSTSNMMCQKGLTLLKMSWVSS